MHRHLKTESGDYVDLFDSVSDMVDAAVECGDKYHRYVFTDASFVGRQFWKWDEVRKAVDEPWSEGEEKVNGMLEKLRTELPIPKSRKRTMRWNEEAGDVNADRVLHGDPDYFRESKRTSRKGLTNVSIFCNMGLNGGYSSDAIFWKGAAAIACVDVLEDAGYTCEIWGWARNMGLYDKESETETFAGVRLKDAGDPLDTAGISRALSGWFYRTVALAIRNSNGRQSNDGYGKPIRELTPEYRGHLDTVCTTEIQMPICTDQKDAVRIAKEILEKVIQDND